MIIAIDPGPHTGLAYFEELEGGVVGLHHTVLLEAFAREKGVYGAEQYHYLLTTVLLPTTRVVVCEDFRTTRVMGQETYHTLHLIGWIRGLAAVGQKECVMQLPSYRKAFKNEAHLLARKLHTPTYRISQHEQDAIAQGLAYLARKGKAK